jgi:hypothetical protein
MLCCRSPPDMRAVGENVDARALQGSQLSRHYSLRGNTNRKCPREVSRRLAYFFLAATDFAFPSSLLLFKSFPFYYIFSRGQSAKPSR